MALIDDVWWAALVGRLLHPTQIQIIEALRWIDEPLSVKDLGMVVSNKGLTKLLHHLRQLNKLGAVEAVFKTRQVASQFDVFYRLAIPLAGRNA